MAENLADLSDRDLLAELRIYNNAALTAPGNLNLTAAQAADLQTDLDAYEATLDALDQANAAYDSALAEKKESRQKVLTTGREQRKLSRARSDIPAGLLAAAGLVPFDGAKTPSPDPSSVPFALIEYGKLRHTVNFRDKEAPNTRRKPRGMLGAEIWLKLGGEPPVDNKECQYLVTDTATPYVVTFDAANVGKTAWYLLRWVSRNGTKGDWSEAVGATVNG